MRLLPALFFLTFSLTLAAQSKPIRSPRIKTPEPKAAETTPAVVPVPEVPKPKVKPRVRIQTSYGPFLLELESELAPKTVENFLTYIKEGFYDGLIFHRVIRGVVVQGGGMKEDMSEKPTHPPIFNEARQVLEAGLKNTAGSVAMARGESPHSGAAQFFINMTDNPQFDPQGSTPEGYGYCVFGHVVEGMEVLAKIEKVQVGWRKGHQCVPDYAVRIKSAELLPEPTPVVAPTPAAATPEVPTPVKSNP